MERLQRRRRRGSAGGRLRSLPSPQSGCSPTALFVTHLAVTAACGQTRGSLRSAGRRHRSRSAWSSPETRSSSLTTSSRWRCSAEPSSGSARAPASSPVSTSCARAEAGPILQGVYGGATMAGGGLALMFVPPLTDADGWRAPYWSAAAPRARRPLVPTLAATGLPRIGHVGEGVLRDRRARPSRRAAGGHVRSRRHRGQLGWCRCSSTREQVRPQQVSRPGSSSRPASSRGRQAGRWQADAARARRRRLCAPRRVAWALGCSRSVARSALSVVGSLAIGLGAGLPFAVIFAAAQRRRPDAPAAAIALVNACGVLTILVGTPLAGLAFELPGDGRLAFAAIAALALSALLALRKARHLAR